MVILSCKTMQAHEQCWHDVLDSLIIEAPLGMLATAQAIRPRINIEQAASFEAM